MSNNNIKESSDPLISEKTRDYDLLGSASAISSSPYTTLGSPLGSILNSDGGLASLADGSLHLASNEWFPVGNKDASILGSSQFGDIRTTSPFGSGVFSSHSFDKESSRGTSPEIIDKLTSRLDEALTKINKAEKEISELEGRVKQTETINQQTVDASTRALDTANKAEVITKKIEKESEEFEQKIEKLEAQKINIIETLGIFVALFTFISTEFQVYKIYQHPFTIAGLTLIILGCLLIFVTVLDIFLVGKRDKLTLRFVLMIIWVLLIATGIYFFISSPETKDKYVRYNTEDYGIYIDKYLDINNSVQDLKNQNKNLLEEIEKTEKNNSNFTVEKDTQIKNLEGRIKSLEDNSIKK